MGGKSSTSTQQVSIPPEVLARYNAVNARAEQAAGTPFQPYSYNPADFVAQMTPTQLAGIQNINYAAGQAQPYYDEATGQLMGAQQAAVPYYGAAADIYGQAYNQAQPLNQMALQQYYGGLEAASPLTQAALQNLAYGQAQGQDITGASLSQLGAAQQAAAPYQQLATQYGLAGATSVGPGYLNTQAYMSPYMQGVVAPTAALLNQQNQQAMAGQTANAIRSGAFGGDRASIAAANLAQQQQLATGKVLGELMQSGYGQSLSTAQQQQQLALQAEQANRSAQAAAAQQFLGIGQQGFGQALQSAEQQRAAAQQLFGQGATTAQQQAALAQQLYGQQTGTGQAVQGLAQQLYQQGVGLGQAQQGVGKELYGMGASTAQQLAALGQGAQGAALQGAQAQLAAGQAQQQTAQAGLQAMYNQYLQQQGYPFQVAQFLANVAMGTGALSGSTTTTNQPGGLFSDARLKENIEEVGRTYDDQPIYKYNFKGSPKTEIGLIAQEVEKRHPEAVGKKAGFKTVDYDKATKRAGLGHVIDGEYTVKEGGHVHPEHAGLGFADGGMPYSDPTPAGLNIPNEKPEIKELATAGKSPGPGRSTMEDVKDIASTVASIAAIAASDARVKENIEEIGKLHDGQKVYRYNFKGDPKKQIGLIAQEVEHHYPKAVHEHNGLKMVDYDRATEVAAHAARADGGRTGYADGGSPGLVSPSDMAALLQAQAQMFGPYSQANRPMGGSPGGAGFVPAGNLPVSSLAVARELPRQASALEQAKQIGDVGKSATEIYQTGKKEGWWGKEKDPLVEELKGYDIFARGGVAGRNGYEDGGKPTFGDYSAPEIDVEGPKFVTRNGEIIGVRPPESNEPSALASAFGKIREFGQSLRPGVAPGSDPWAEVFGGSQRAPGLGAAQSPDAPPPVSAADIYAGPDRSQQKRPGLAPSPAAPVSRDQVQQFMTDVGGEQAVAAPSAPASPTAERDLGMAPSLEGSTVPGTPVLAGLGAATKPTAAKAPAEPGKLNKFLEWAKKPENFIPLATGITGTIMAPTRNPLVAAAYGLQSGVNAYQPTLKSQAEIDRARAEALAKRVSIPKGAIFDVGGVRYYMGADGRPYTPSEWKAAGRPPLMGGEMAAKAAEDEAARMGVTPTAAAPAAQPAVAPGAPATQAAAEPNAPDAQALQIAAKENEQMMDLPEEQRALKADANQKIINGAYAQRNEAIPLGNVINESSRALMPMFKAGPLTAGAGIEERAKFFNIVNTTLRALGFSPSESIDAALSDQQVGQKFSTLLAGQRAQSLNQDAYAALQTLQGTVANGTMTESAVARILADLYVSNQQNIDFANYLDIYAGSQSDSIIANRARGEFQRQKSQKYEDDRKMLEGILTRKDTKTGEPLINYLLGVGQDKALQRQFAPKYIEKNFPGVMRYIYRN
jgi:hypothetical protein